MLLLVAGPFFGYGMLVLVLVALDVIPWILSFVASRFPNSWFLYKWYPGVNSIYISLVIMVFGIFIAAWMINDSADFRQISASMIFLAIPHSLAEIPSLFGREGRELANVWPKRVAEFACFSVFALIVFEVIRLV